MSLFTHIPENFFSILSSAKKELYVQALFVLRQAFKTELVIRREDLLVMLMDTLDTDIEEADFTEESILEGEPVADEGALSQKAHLLLRRLKETGWIETEYEARTFEENITIPDYAISVINLLYELSTEKVREYNSYVYATYAALRNADEFPDYTFQALQTAYNNTVSLVDELKSLYNNIRRYYRLVPEEDNVNELLRTHFDEYKTAIVDTVYYPLKTMDSVPRFKHAILSILNGWLLDDRMQQLIIKQGITRHIFESEEQGQEEMFRMINYVADTYDGIEEMIREIDGRHNEYVNASVEHIRYLMNVDRGVKGRLIELLKASRENNISDAMSESLNIYGHMYYDQKSLYARVKRTKRSEGESLAIRKEETPPEMVDSFLKEVRKQYTNKKIDHRIEEWFGEAFSFATEEIRLNQGEDFIFFLLGTIRGTEKDAGYTVKFREGNIEVDGCSLPRAVFTKKKIHSNGSEQAKNSTR